MPTLTVDCCCETDIVRNNQSKNAAGNDRSLELEEARRARLAVCCAPQGPLRGDLGAVRLLHGGHLVRPVHRRVA